MVKTQQVEIEKKVQAIRAFIDNPCAEKAIEAGHCSLCMCWIADYDEGQSCEECIWDIACQPYTVDPASITDEEVSVLLLDAIKRLTIYEAEHD